jgi:hypothetical protein
MAMHPLPRLSIHAQNLWVHPWRQVFFQVTRKLHLLNITGKNVPSDISILSRPAVSIFLTLYPLSFNKIINRVWFQSFTRWRLRVHIPNFDPDLFQLFLRSRSMFQKDPNQKISKNPLSAFEFLQDWNKKNIEKTVIIINPE